MRQQTATRSMLCGLAILIVLVGFSAWHLVRLGTRIDDVIQLRDDLIMQVIRETVTRQNGSTVEVSTTRNEGESLEDWQTRHDNAVDHFKNT